MLSHIMLGSNNIERSKTFYDKVLGVLGVEAPIENVNDTGQKRLFYIHKGMMFSLTEPINGEPMSVGNGTTVGFVCDSAEQVKAFHDVAVLNGATSIEQPPGYRENAMGKKHLCYFRDPDGHKICGIYRL